MLIKETNFRHSKKLRWWGGRQKALCGLVTINYFNVTHCFDLKKNYRETLGSRILEVKTFEEVLYFFCNLLSLLLLAETVQSNTVHGVSSISAWSEPII